MGVQFRLDWVITLPRNTHTDQQYGRMQVMLGPKSVHETYVPPLQLILL